MAGPLSGVRVIDFTEYVAGPYAGQMLADMGADVVKFEPPIGDFWRLTNMIAADESRGFISVNRGKRSIVVDLKAEGTSRLMMDLPSQLTATGATKQLTFANSGEQKTFKLAIHSKRGPGADELYTLRLSVRAANNTTYTQSMPIRPRRRRCATAPRSTRASSRCASAP